MLCEPSTRLGLAPDGRTVKFSFAHTKEKPRACSILTSKCSVHPFSPVAGSLLRVYPLLPASILLQPGACWLPQIPSKTGMGLECGDVVQAPLWDQKGTTAAQLAKWE